MARDCDLWLALGANELERGIIYDALLLYSPIDGLVLHHRKLVPANHERLVWGQGAAARLEARDAALPCRRAHLLESQMPDGRYLAGPLWDEEGLLVAELDPELLYEERQRFDPAGRCHPTLKIAGSSADAFGVRRVASLLSVLALSAAVAGAPATGGGATTSRRAALEGHVLRALNAARARHGLRPLRLSPALHTAAASHGLEMARDGYFAHPSADGAPFWRRVERFYPVGGFRSWALGENLLWESPSVTAGQVVELWLRSPPHRANVLDAAFREVGVAAVSSPAAPGVYRGLPVTIVIADFGARTG